jgi:hypothetical protein
MNPGPSGLQVCVAWPGLAGVIDKVGAPAVCTATGAQKPPVRVKEPPLMDRHRAGRWWPLTPPVLALPPPATRPQAIEY